MAIVSDPFHHDSIATLDPETAKAVRPKLLPPYNLILDNDDHHSFEFVIMVLSRALGFSAQKAYQYTLEAHTEGQAVLWTGPKEVAEFKLEQVLTFHEDRDDGRKLGPLGCHIEPSL
jgi:ATP-dependent Clp protease adaptor protein ClpS